MAARPNRDLRQAEAYIGELEAKQKELLRQGRLDKRQLSTANRRLREAATELEFVLSMERRRAHELEDSYYDMVLRLSRASGYKDRETGAHIQRVGHYSQVLACRMGWSEGDQQLISRAAPMHDLGKIAIPDALIRKRGRLCPEDRMVMENHTLIGASLLEGSNSRLLEMARDIALTHHEHWDGSGYPRRLSGGQIPLPGRIVKLADTYDALRSQRSYKRGFSHQTAARIILSGDGRTLPAHFDPVLLDIFRGAGAEMASIFDVIHDE